MATVHFGRLLGPVGFSRTVAIKKRLHPQFAADADFVAMFVDEARHAARVQHPNVVQTLDVVQAESELLLVMEYIHGESLHALLRQALGERGADPSMAYIAVGRILHQALFGLHAAHEARDEQGEPLDLVHRDMSPHNILVGVDGIARVLDFGVAKTGSAQITQDGQIKGKLSYFPPEQLTQEHVIDRRADVYAAAATLWEALAGRRLIQGENEFQRITKICCGEIPRLAHFAGVSPALEAVVMRGLARDPEARYPTARAMALALEAAIAPASSREIGEWVEAIGGEALRLRQTHIASIERHSSEIAAGTSDEPVFDGPISAVLGTEGTGRVSSLPSYRPGRASTPPLERWSSPPGGSLAPPEIRVEIDEPAPKRGRAWVAALLLLVLLTGVASVTGPGRRLRTALVALRAETSTTNAAPVPSVATTTAIAPAAPPPTGAPPPELAPSAPPAPANDALVLPPAHARAHARPTRPVASGSAVSEAPSMPPRSPATTAAPAPVPGDCAVPYTIDSQGIRHPEA